MGAQVSNAVNAVAWAPPTAHLARRNALGLAVTVAPERDAAL